MKKIRILSLLLCLVLVVLYVCMLSACQKPKAHTNNEAASYFYGYSLYNRCLVRYDFNAAGQPLAAVFVDWYTFQALEILSKPTYDRRYEYDHEGRLVGHEVHGASLTLEYDEAGNPVRGIGFSNNAEMVMVEYTCTEQGRILSERVICQSLDFLHPRAAVPVVYTYDEKGRLIGENSYAYHYGENSITFEFMDEETPRSVEITLTETGDICSLACPDSEEHRYDWVYDDQGRCISSKGRVLSIIWTTVGDCQMTRNENGQLIEANIDRFSVLPGRSITDYRYCFVYDETGAIRQTVVSSYEGDSPLFLRETRDFVGGTLVKYTQEDIGVKQDGQEILHNWYYTEYDKKTGKNLRSVYYLGKDELQTELIQQYDKKDRWQGSFAKDYMNGQLFTERTVEYGYGEKGDIVSMTAETIYVRHNFRRLVVCEYTDGLLTHNETTEERIEDAS